MSAIKFGESLSKFVIPIALLELNSVASQSARDKPSIARKQEAHPILFWVNFTKCDPGDFKYYHGKINNKTVNFVFDFGRNFH